jgi:anti-anti-sigma factor
VDLSGLPFLDCVGLSALVAGRRRARLLGGSLIITGPTPPVARLLQLTGLNLRLAVVPGPECALPTTPGAG